MTEAVDAHRAAVAARIPIAQDRARAKVARLSARGMDAGDAAAAERFRAAAARAGSTRQRVVWLHRFVSSAVAAAQSVSACEPGCAHCCHLGVLITDVEASLLARASGRVASTPDADVSWRVADLVTMVQVDPETMQRTMDAQTERARALAGQPCPFLDRAQGLCTVYDARPAACRTHMNLDDDALLCRLDAGDDIPLPLFDGHYLKALLFSAQPAGIVADIRAFFPNGPDVADLPA